MDDVNEGEVCGYFLTLSDSETFHLLGDGDGKD